MRDAATVQRPLSVFKVNSPFTVPALCSWNAASGTLRLFSTQLRVLTLKKMALLAGLKSFPSAALLSLPLRCALALSLHFLFSGGYLFSSLSSPKGFPSASDYLWQQLVCWQPSGPVWRLRSRSSPQTSPRTWGEGRWAGKRASWLGRLY